ncbi:hypothetical protein Tco_1127482 [Tanacetum coccineum]
MATKEAKDLATLPFNEIIGNLKVYEMILENDGVASKTTKEKAKSLALKAKVTREQTSDDNDSQGESDEDVIDLEVVIDSETKLIGSEEDTVITLRTKEVKAQDKSEVSTFAWKKVTLLVSVQFLRRTRLLSEELRVIVKMVMNLKMTLLVS